MDPSPLPEGQDLAELKRVAEAVSTPGNIDSAPESGEYGYKETNKWYACPTCDGHGEIQGAAYCNWDGKALGVQFFGIGAEFGQWEAYFRAFPPKVVLRLLSELETARGERDEYRRDGLEAALRAISRGDRLQRAEADLSRALEALGRIRDDYCVNHTSKWCRNFASEVFTSLSEKGE